jgi:site-specific recombinase XerD
MLFPASLRLPEVVESANLLPIQDLSPHVMRHSNAVKAITPSVNSISTLMHYQKGSAQPFQVLLP